MEKKLINKKLEEIKPIINKIDSLNFDEEYDREKTVRFVCISDTHTKTNNYEIPEGDVLIHSGDFTSCGEPHQVLEFSKFLDAQPHKYKIVIAGNHDITFDKDSFENLNKLFKIKAELKDLDQIKNNIIEKENVFYLEETSCNVFGYNIYGSPYTPNFYDWAFMGDDYTDLKKRWENIPDGVDILITHGPPKYIGDKCADGIFAGSYTLLEEIQKRIKPKYHIFGHIHEAYGIWNDGITTYINCCALNRNYNRVNKPIVFDLPINQL